MKKALKAIRYEQECAHNRKFKRKVQSEIQNEVQAKVEEKKLQIDFLNSMIRELEEKYAIEKRKKTVLKNQCDQAYLRGVSAISTEAMKMSNSTLDDMYRGMKMPTYSNDNIYH
jgi:regulator of PEP synthase PpsR (kinase-PPPase family)